MKKIITVEPEEMKTLRSTFGTYHPCWHQQAPDEKIEITPSGQAGLYEKMDEQGIEEIIEKYDIFRGFQAMYELVHYFGWEAFEKLRKKFSPEEQEALEWLLTDQRTEQYWDIAFALYDDEALYSKLLEEIKEMGLPAGYALELIDISTL